MARIALVANDAGNLLASRLSLARAARAAGHEVAAVVPASPRAAEIEAQGVAVRTLHLSRRGTNPLVEARAWRTFARLYRELRPDLVHHFTVKPIVYGGLAAREAKVRAVVHSVTGLGFVFTSDAPKARMLRPLVVAAYRRVFAHPNCRVLVQNEDDLAALVAARALPREKAVLIRGSGVAVDNIAPTPEPESVPLVVLPARMLRDKGVVEFVDAARALRARGVDARFALVGDVDDNPESLPRERLEAWAKEGVIEWWGWRNDMDAVHHAASIVCLPSYREGVPRALLEGAAHARPIVTTDAPGCRDAVEPGKSGLLVPPRDARALADALGTLLADPAARARMGMAGRALVEREFSERRVVDETMRVYRELLA
jgi:glycosyltransferase involved in cell wall biosynthesis